MKSVSFLIVLCLFPIPSFSFSGVEYAFDMGYYRDIQKRQHGPVRYRLSYLGQSDKMHEYQLELVLNNDFAENRWTVLPSKALYVFPLSEGLEAAPFRKSRIELGRQFFAESFDVGILDGLTSHHYFSPLLEVNTFLGLQRSFDLSDGDEAPLGGIGLRRTFALAQIRGTLSSRGGSGKGLDTHSTLLTLQSLIPIPSLALAPHFTLKAEWDLRQSSSPPQSLGIVDLALGEERSLYIQHSYRHPQAIRESQEEVFLYDLFSRSSQEGGEVGYSEKIHENVNFQFLARKFRLQAGLPFEASEQQEVRWDWDLGKKQLVSPQFGHLYGYGGELWNMGLDYRFEITDFSKMTFDFSVAHLKKINSIHSWLYQLRAGHERRLGRRWLLAFWGEMERNQIFSFDARMQAHVAYFL